MTRLQDLYANFGQSPWLDNLHRDWLVGGHLAELVAAGVRGVTSNPTIFAKAMSEGDAYDEQLGALASFLSVEDAYWEMAVTDVTHALEVLAPVHQESGGTDGFVSLEVAPALAHDTAGTVAAARRLHQRIDRPNLLVKVPATAEGVPAIRQLIGEGRSVNVTLIFSLERYQAVMEAYLSGLEDYLAAGATDLSPVASVASFFVSRVDTEVDRCLEALAAGPTGGGILVLSGRAGVAQAQAAYGLFTKTFSGARWTALAAQGARVQRPLWASTSTKNPAYPDLLYVDTLIGGDTVNTMPEPTLAAFEDHGVLARTVDAHPGAPQAVLEALADAGVDLADVTQVLEDEGVSAFAKSFDELLAVLSAKAAAMKAGSAP